MKIISQDSLLICENCGREIAKAKYSMSNTQKISVNDWDFINCSFTNNQKMNCPDCGKNFNLTLRKMFKSK